MKYRWNGKDFTNIWICSPTDGDKAREEIMVVLSVMNDFNQTLNTLSKDIDNMLSESYFINGIPQWSLGIEVHNPETKEMYFGYGVDDEIIQDEQLTTISFEEFIHTYTFKVLETEEDIENINFLD